MSYCKRVPPHPLDTSGALAAEVTEALTKKPVDEPFDHQNLDALYSFLASVRRHIHANPEPGWEESNTNRFLRTVLTRCAGIDESNIKPCTSTGLVINIFGTGPAQPSPPPIKVIAIRADMDALRMTEGNKSLPYRSTNEGVAHLCGHDGHMATLVGAACLIQRKRHLLPQGTCVRLLFQPAEEGPGGAEPMLKQGCLEGVDEIYGLHNWPAYDLGVIAIVPGPIMAHPTSFVITIEGKGGHGSQPHACVDPILVSAHVVTALQSIVSRSVHSKKQAVVSVTTIHGGEVSNVIPDKVTMTGTIRDLEPAVCETILTRCHEIVTGVCAAFGARGKFVPEENTYPVLSNHPAQTEIVERLAKKHGIATTDSGLPMLGAEDFSYFLMPEHGGKPGCFFFLGSKEPSLTNWATYGGPTDAARTNCGCHNTQFDYNDNLLPMGAVFWVRLVEDRLGTSLYSDEELPMQVPGAGASPAGLAAAQGEALPEAGAPPAAPKGPISLQPAAKKRRST